MSHQHITIINTPHTNSSFLFNSTSISISHLHPSISTSIHNPLHLHLQPVLLTAFFSLSSRVFVIVVGAWFGGIDFFHWVANLRVNFLIAFFHLLLFVESIFFFFLIFSSSFWIRVLHLLFNRHLHLLLVNLYILIFTLGWVCCWRAFEPLSSRALDAPSSPHRAVLLFVGTRTQSVPNPLVILV